MQSVGSKFTVEGCGETKGSTVSAKQQKTSYAGGKGQRCSHATRLPSTGEDLKCELGEVPRLGWESLPSEALLQVLIHLPIVDLGHAAQVCHHWHRVSQHPQLWQRVEFVLSHSNRSYTKPTPTGLINFILKNHAQHLKFVIFKTDSSVESAQAACHILSKLVNCSLKTLALMSSARPAFLDMDQASFLSALTVVLARSPTLTSLAIDHTPVDDPSLQALANTNCRTLELLRMKSCPWVSPRGIRILADHCRSLRQLSISYTLLSDELLLALSSEQHVRIESLRVDVYSEKDSLLQQISPRSWRALVQRSPAMDLIMYFFVIPDESFDCVFESYIPATHLYFGVYVPKRVLGRLGRYCPRLRELVVGANGGSLIDQELLDIGQSCSNLASLGLGECEVSCRAFVEFARMCGPRLRELYVMEECLVEDAQLDVAHLTLMVSELLGRDWAPEFMPVW